MLVKTWVLWQLKNKDVQVTIDQISKSNCRIYFSIWYTRIDYRAFTSRPMPTLYFVRILSLCRFIRLEQIIESVLFLVHLGQYYPFITRPFWPSTSAVIQTWIHRIEISIHSQIVIADPRIKVAHVKEIVQCCWLYMDIFCRYIVTCDYYL